MVNFKKHRRFLRIQQMLENNRRRKYTVFTKNNSEVNIQRVVSASLSGATGGAVIGGAIANIPGAIVGGVLGSVVTGVSAYENNVYERKNSNGNSYKCR